ncbi:hypothetical protein BGW80DRAFT_1332744 [Lactifluus volemus]|nr:hypothetical protein BGW80DRAFT_1332744 [Lactifluus volemus]
MHTRIHIVKYMQNLEWRIMVLLSSPLRGHLRHICHGELHLRLRCHHPHQQQ